ncbi:MAG: nucleotidyltransferase family protein [Betaproteobacteria bacterium]|nr:nucleotidyltransferase family protein [Betaproteobacteria bacterium]
MKAFIFAAGRGERMRPLTDTTPKPLLTLGGKPLIVWHIERLVRAGFRDLIINTAWLGEQIETALGDGSQWGARIVWSHEGEALETAGGIAYALAMLGDEPFLSVSADIFSDYDYARLAPRLQTMRDDATAPDAHLVMVPNPPFHPHGDFALRADGLLALDGAQKYNYAGFSLHRPALFRHIAPGTKLAMRPIWNTLIPAGRASGELHTGVWENIGTLAQLAALNQRLTPNTEASK